MENQLVDDPHGDILIPNDFVCLLYAMPEAVHFIVKLDI